MLTSVKLALIGLCLLLYTTSFALALALAGTRVCDAASTRRVLRFEADQIVYDELELDIVVGDDKQQQRSLLSTSSSSIALASNELQALQALYVALGGKKWHGKTDTAT